VRRPDKGLLGGMAGLPTSEWGAARLDEAAALEHAPVSALWDKLGEVRHVFTHFSLTLDVYAARAAPKGEGWWGDKSALPTVFRKAVELGERIGSSE
ncbi:MAG TPA: NUDIX domain-containing protein, partial [Terricaulis sp.]|nr:NUDIX domain-containing protein [Terricaulis sp.]